jgi:hypothetical protein
MRLVKGNEKLHFYSLHSKKMKNCSAAGGDKNPAASNISLMKAA